MLRESPFLSSEGDFCRGPSSFYDFDENNPYLEQKVQRNSHQAHIEDVGCGGQKSGQNRNEKEGIPSVPGQKGCVDNPDVTQ